MTITRDDVRDALAYAMRNGAKVAINVALSNEANFRAIMRAGDDAGQDALRRHTFAPCTCCTHRAESGMNPRATLP